MRKSAFLLFGIIGFIPMAYGKLSATKFPGTVEDISFKSRLENINDGYEPFLDKKAYQELNIVPGEEIYTDHMIAAEEAQMTEQESDAKTMTREEYCKKYPHDETRCPPKTETPAEQPNQPAKPSEPSQPSQPSQPTRPSEPSQPARPTPPPSEPTPSKPPYSTTPYAGYTIGGGTVVENNIVIGGSCYPADHDRHFPNKILTTGKFENMYPALEKGLITIFRKEGKCGTIKNDPCGYTCYGIGSSPKCSGVVVHSAAEAEDFYYERYWKKYGFYKLPDVISADVFIAAMASGPGTALSQFRKFLGLPSKKSAVDDAMINAVKRYHGDIHNDWMNVRDAFLQEVARKRYGGSVSRGYKNAIELKRKNGCHVRPEQPLYR
jgi:hypothetical protein